MDDIVALESCKSCSGIYEYSWLGWTTKIFAGIPTTRPYKVISYVWGNTKPLPLICFSCGITKTIPMESSLKFWKIMTSTAISGETIWLDALSIDQSDPKDIAYQIPLMGETYSQAESVAVLLPSSDKDAFSLLFRLGELASIINTRKLEFSRNEETLGGQDLSQVCQDFWSLLEEFESSLHKWTYWQRAWTFQEWALAGDISMSWEGTSVDGNITHVKFTVLFAGTLMAVYKLKFHQYATIKIGCTRGEAPRKFQSLRRLFPDERAFIPEDMVPEREAQFDNLMSSLRFGSALGLRSTKVGNKARFEGDPPIHESFDLNAAMPTSPVQRQMERMVMVLNSFGTTRRQARFEADLVACWASMCAINYEYDKNDSFAVALQKVMNVLRKDYGVRIFNFLVNTEGASGEIDLQIQQYATAHKQCNATNNHYFHGTPAFSGRADTAIHFRNAITQSSTRVSLNSSGVPIFTVGNGEIENPVLLDDTKATAAPIIKCLSGQPDTLNFTDVLENVTGVLSDLSPDQLKSRMIVVIKLGSKPAIDADVALRAWVVFSADTNLSQCFIAREGLNGTLVIAQPSQKGHRLVAYLTITDQFSGTHLVVADLKGTIDMTFVTPVRGDQVNSANLDDRRIVWRVDLEEEEFVAY
ncbi:heterokaryon incompatibility protein-domain-containing protein [Hyaloscypha sp. PMI_1271]|nr:heterokaryon incompatibility protein-domain-containing protein [Hyaloscypha sp. PMI_1271]